MNISQLVAGHHGVKTREGGVYVVVYSSHSEENFLLGASSYAHLDGYWSNLTHSDHSSLDIVKVFTLKDGPCLNSEFGMNVIWKETSKQGLESQLRELEENLSAREVRINEVKDKISLVKRQLTVTAK